MPDSDAKFCAGGRNGEDTCEVNSKWSVFNLDLKIFDAHDFYDRATAVDLWSVVMPTRSSISMVLLRMERRFVVRVCQGFIPRYNK